MKNLRHIAYRAFIGLLFVGAIVSSSPAQAASGFSNPLLPRRADPYVYLHTDGNYYFCATVPEYDRIELARARDLAGLRTATPVVVWRKQKRLLVEDRNLSAPELHYLDGKWFIYYAAGTSLDPYDVRIRVIENDSADPMTGGWNDKGRLATGRDTLSLDATVFELGGSRYLLWAQRLTASDKSSMDLYIAKMKDPLTLAGKPAMIGRASESWEMRDPANLKMQGPAVLERNGRVFVSSQQRHRRPLLHRPTRGVRTPISSIRPPGRSFPARPWKAPWTRASSAPATIVLRPRRMVPSTISYTTRGITRESKGWSS